MAACHLSVDCISVQVHRDRTVLGLQRNEHDCSCLLAGTGLSGHNDLCESRLLSIVAHLSHIHGWENDRHKVVSCDRHDLDDLVDFYYTKHLLHIWFDK